MKNYNKLVITLIALFGAALSLQATYVGTSVGYMIDGEEEIISAQVGWTVKETGDITHNLELEVAYSSASEEGISFDITPVMVNYIIKSTQESGLTLYAGAGIGYSFWDLSYMDMSATGEELTLQGLVGLEYGISETTSFRAGYRYIYLDDIEDSGVSADDSVIELGLVFSF
jgi:opacity protein-like surface antigen